MSATVPTVDLEPLFEPIAINGLSVPNRFVMPAMQRGLARDGDPGALGPLYRERVEGGVGLVISESTAVPHYSANWQPTATRMDVDTLASWGAVIRDVHAAGGLFFQQLWHPGACRVPNPGQPEHTQPSLSPSGLISPGKKSGKAMSLDELREVQQAYVHCAVLARGLGADGVEVHGAHGYLIDQFLWPGTNLRTDEYGGDIAGRARFGAEIVAEIRRVLDPDVPISFRISQWKEHDFDGKVAESPEELGELLAILTAAGVDVFHLSARRFYTPEWPDRDPKLGLAGWAKRYTDVPVITVGSVGLSCDLASNLWLGEEALPRAAETLTELATRFSANEFDLVAVGRSLIGDPAFIAKIREGRYEDIDVYDPAEMLRMAKEWAVDDLGAH